MKNLTLPTTGRVVHYVLANGQHRPALVTHVPAGVDGTCNLTVVLDSTDLQLTPGDSFGLIKPELLPEGEGVSLAGVLFEQNVKHDELEQQPGTWHWPERPLDTFSGPIPEGR